MCKRVLNNFISFLKRQILLKQDENLVLKCCFTKMKDEMLPVGFSCIEAD